VVIVAALLAATGINALLANGAAADARKAADLRNADVAAGEEAVRRDAGRADYWNELGRARFVARDWKGAEVAFLGAARRAPYNATYWGNLARTRAAAVQTKAGGTAADAIVAARRGIESDPSDPVPYATLADVALAVGENQVALAAAGEAIRLYTRAPSYDVVAAKAAAGMSDRAAARAMLEDIVRTKDSAVLRVALARICVELRDQSAARQNAQRALQLEPNNQEARAILDSLG